MLRSFRFVFFSHVGSCEMNKDDSNVLWRLTEVTSIMFNAIFT